MGVWSQNWEGIRDVEISLAASRDSRVASVINLPHLCRCSLHHLCRCSSIIGDGCKLTEFKQADQDKMITNLIEPMANDALRTICIAYKDYVKSNYLSSNNRTQSYTGAQPQLKS